MEQYVEISKTKGTEKREAKTGSMKERKDR
jgi:hypothetical protein